MKMLRKLFGAPSTWIEHAWAETEYDHVETVFLGLAPEASEPRSDLQRKPAPAPRAAASR
jgi:hypothetical protein